MPSILEDKVLSVRLAAQPEFHVRLVEFLHAYGVIERAALVVQARPHPGNAPAGVNLDDTEIQRRFMTGIRTRNGWWQGFRSMVGLRHTFHGIASLPSNEKPGWASELHRDGHFIAGIWTFPQLTVQGKDVMAVADFYVDMFSHFLQLIELTLEPISKQPSYDATWTLTHAPTLHYASQSIFDQRTVTASPLQVLHLQSPVSTGDVRTPQWTELAVRMGQAFAGAYGDERRSAE